MRKAEVWMHGLLAGILYETDEGFVFKYNEEYCKNETSEPVSFTLPKSEVAFKSRTMFSFFDGLIPEGWLLYLAEKNWKLNARDRMGLLMVCCQDCIGAVSVKPIIENEENE